MKPSPLTPQHRSAGTSLESALGTELVKDFGDVRGEYDALRDGAGLLDLAFLRAVQISGADTADYLHRRLSNSVKSLAVGGGCHTGLLRPDGTMIAEMTVHRTGEAAFLALVPALAEDALIESLEKFIFSEECAVSRTEASVLGLVGPESAKMIETALGVGVDRLAEWGIAAGTDGLSVARLQVSLQPAFALVGIDPARRWSALTAAGARPCGMGAFHVHRIEAGLPLFGVDHDDSWMPADAGLESIVDFEKGCFPGQEAVAKAHNVGHPRHVLRGFTFEASAPPAPGTPFFLEKSELGSVTSVCESPALGRPIGLGHLKWKWREETGALQLGHEGTLGTAHPVALPFDVSSR
jgi:folate-binding protein YgfZ